MPSIVRSSLKIAAVLFLLALASAVPALDAAHGGGKPGSLSAVGAMHEVRASHTATRLPNGTVLIAGGFKKVRTYDQEYTKSAEIYDAGTKSFTAAGNLNVARCGHTATTLADGMILLAGGGNDSPLASAELYDPRTGAFTLLGEMAAPRQGHTATLLNDGNVLIVGGTQADRQSAELFDAKTRRFKRTGTTAVDRLAGSATLLPGGRVLVAGGAIRDGSRWTVLASAEIYDPGTGTFAPTGAMSMARYKHGSVLLSDGTVLIAGGSDERDGRGKIKTAELYDQKTGSFARVDEMQSKRFKLPDGITLLLDGTALVSVGSEQMEVYDPKRKSFSPAAAMKAPRFFATATLLSDGSVLIAGGYDAQVQATGEAYIYTP